MKKYEGKITINSPAHKVSELIKSLGFTPSSTGLQTHPKFRKDHVMLDVVYAIVNYQDRDKYCAVTVSMRTSKGGYAMLTGEEVNDITGLKVPTSYWDSYNPPTITIAQLEKEIKKFQEIPPIPITERGKVPKLQMPKICDFVDDFEITKDTAGKVVIKNTSVISTATLDGVFAINEKNLQVKDASDPNDKPWFLISIRGYTIYNCYVLTDGEQYYKARTQYYPSKNKYIPRISDKLDFKLSKSDQRTIKKLLTTQE